MPLLRITVTGDDTALHESDAPLLSALRHALAADPGPVTIMVHGYKYAPGTGASCPHDTLFARDPVHGHRRVTSWPRHLGLRGQHGEGLGLSFGWDGRGSLWQAHARALQAGRALARLVETLRSLDPARPVNVIAHSLGARVALAAVAAGQPGAISHLVLLAAAEFAGTACTALRSEAGRHTRVLNVTSRENDVYDFLYERCIAPEAPGDRTLGHGVPDLPNLVTLQLDDARSLDALRDAGFPIAPPDRLVCHWSPYLRAGVFPLYLAVLSGRMTLPQLRAILPEAPAPRWSRLRSGAALWGMAAE